MLSVEVETKRDHLGSYTLNDFSFHCLVTFIPWPYCLFEWLNGCGDKQDSVFLWHFILVVYLEVLKYSSQ